MYQVANYNKPVMSSREIAVQAGKMHKHVLEAVRKMEPAWEKITGTKFGLSEYTDSTGRSLPEYLLTKTETLYIATKFNDEARAKLVLRWEQLENSQAAKFKTAEGHLAQAINLLQLEESILKKEADSLREKIASIEHRKSVINDILSSRVTSSEATDIRHTDWRHDFEREFGDYALNFIEENIELWLTMNEIYVSDFNKTHYEAHKNIGTKQLLKAISAYCYHTNIRFVQHKVVKRDGSAKRVHVFFR